MFEIEKVLYAKQNMLYGSLWVVGGTIATAISNGAVLFWGAIIFGGYQFLKGFFPYLKYRIFDNTSYDDSPKAKSYCNRCSHNEAGSKFCIYCGKALNNNSGHKNIMEDTLFGYAITLIAYVAKADGIVSNNEAEIISKLLTHISDGNTRVREALKDVYAKAKDSSIKNHKVITGKFIAIAMREFSENDRQDFNKLFTRWLLLLVYADGHKNTSQNHIVYEITQLLNMNDSYVQELHREFSHHKKEESRHYQAESNSTKNSYEILKCNSTNTDGEIKKAYRELAKQYHPDVISSKGLAEDFILFANQKFKEVNTAYEIIKKHRGMK